MYGALTLLHTLGGPHGTYRDAHGSFQSMRPGEVLGEEQRGAPLRDLSVAHTSMNGIVPPIPVSAAPVLPSVTVSEHFSADAVS